MRRQKQSAQIKFGPCEVTEWFERTFPPSDLGGPFLTPGLAPASRLIQAKPMELINKSKYQM